MRRLSALVAVVSLAVASLVAQQPPPAMSAARPTAFVNVTALPMTTNAALANWTVVVADGKVVSMGPSTAVRPPAGALVINGLGKFLMPGLTEMHGHIPAPTSSASFIEDVLFLYVASGVTTVRGMQGAAGQLTLRERAARNEIVAPTLYLAGPAFSGGTVKAPADAEARVKQQKQEGWDLLKVQTGLSIETYEAMARTAREIGISFSGHVPAAVGVDRALTERQAAIDHMDLYVETLGGQSERLSDNAINDFAEKIRRSGVWNVPTMYVWDTLRGAVTLESRTSLPELKYLPATQIQQWTTALGNRLKNPQFDAAGARHYIENRKRLLAALNRVGARIVLGSDAPQQFNVPGFSIHREMVAMVEAGMSPYAVLRSGTATVGEHFLQKDNFGAIAIGQRADFLLLDANPLVNVANAAKRSGVMLRGRWIPEAEIQTRLAAIAKTNAAAAP